MTDKYVDVTLSTGLNDGSSPANAWQSLIQVLNNTMASGSIVAGDVIHVRTHDGLNNCSESMTANLTMVTPTDVANPTTFIFDDGTVWTNGGIFRIDGTTVPYDLIFKDHINMECFGTDYRLEYYTGYSSTGALNAVQFAANTINGFHINAPNFSGYDLAVLKSTILINLKVTAFKIRTGYNLIEHTLEVKTRLINPIIEIAAVLTATCSVFQIGSDGSSFEIMGGKIIADASAEQYLYLFYTSGSDAKKATIIDFDSGPIAGMFRTDGSSTHRMITNVNMLGGSSPFDFFEYSTSLIEFKQGDNYPYLNATLPNATNEGWSYKVSPWGADKGLQVPLPPIVKVFNQTAGVKTLTLEFLINTAFTDITTDTLWATFFYVDDTTGEQKNITTFAIGGIIATSTAAWSNTAYGAKSYNKYKIEVTTPTAIKQGTKVTARVISGIPAVGVDDFWFMEPDITIS